MEVYLGTKSDQKFINGYLKEIRTKKPEPLQRIETSSPLSTFLGRGGTERINSILFKRIVSDAENQLKHIDARFDFIDTKRYYICENNDPGDIGGFHGQRKGGYLYIHNIGMSHLLRRSEIHNYDIITLELAKNYIHDSIHASTFRSIRTMPAANFTEYKVYREQYGINFRKPDGTSFSSVEATKKSPLSINLNLLMDGVADHFAEKAVKEQSSKINIVGTTELESTILNQLFGLGFEEKLYPHPIRFLSEVIRPTKLFIDYWDTNQTLLELILRAMFSGDISGVKQFFAGKLNNKDAWDIIFRRPNF